MTSFDTTSPLAFTAVAILSTSFLLLLLKREEVIDMGFHKLDQLSQLFPPKPKFTEKDLPDLAGKVSSLPSRGALISSMSRQNSALY